MQREDGVARALDHEPVRLFALAESQIDRAARGDVAQDAAGGHRPPVDLPGGHAALDVTAGAVLRHQHRLDQAGLVAGQQPAEEVLAGGAVVRMDDVEDVHRRGFRLGVPEGLAPGAVREQDGAVERHALDQLAGAVEDVTQLRFALAQFLGAGPHGRLEVGVQPTHLLLGEFALADVEVGAKDALDLAVGVAERHLAREQRDVGAVGCRLRFFDVQLRSAGPDHGPVVFAIPLGDVAPGHGEVVLAHQVLRVVEAGVAGERGVAAEVPEVAILPEHPHGDGVENRLDHRLRGAKRVLRRFSGRDVGVRTRHPHRLAVRIAHHRAAGEDPLVGAVIAPHAELGLVDRAAAGDVRRQGVDRAWTVVGMDQVGPGGVLVQHLVIVVAEHRLPARREVGRVGAHVPVPQAVGRTFHGHLEPLFAGRTSRLGVLQGRDVGDDPGHEQRAFGVTAHDAAAIDHPFPVARARAQAVLRLVAWRQPVEVRLQRLHHLRQVVGVHVRLEELDVAGDVVGLVVEQLRPGRVARRAAGTREPFPHAEPAAVDREIEAFAALPQPLLVRLAFEGQADDAFGALDELQFQRVRVARLAIVDGEGGDHGAAGVVDRRRPARPQAVFDREGLEVGPQRIDDDVTDDHLTVVEGRRTARTDAGADGDAVDGRRVGGWQRRRGAQAQPSFLDEQYRTQRAGCLALESEQQLLQHGRQRVRPHDELERLLLPAEQRVCLAPAGDVVGDAEQHPLRRVVVRQQGGMHRQPRTVRAGQFELERARLAAEHARDEGVDLRCLGGDDQGAKGAPVDGVHVRRAELLQAHHVHERDASVAAEFRESFGGMGERERGGMPLGDIDERAGRGHRVGTPKTSTRIST